MKIEYEAKFLDVDVGLLRRRLVSLRACNTIKNRLLRRKVFDFPQKTKHTQWVRVRDEGNGISVALKQVSNGAAIDGTRELEFKVDNFEKACTFLEACGFILRAYQENYRESWELKGGFIDIDIWPGLKPFVEIETNDELSVRSLARSLGLNFDSAYYGPVDTVYEQVLGISRQDFYDLRELTFNSNTITKLQGKKNVKEQ